LDGRLSMEKTDYFAYLWTNSDHPPEVLDVIRKHYPFLIRHEWLFNTEYYLFSKNKKTESLTPYYSIFCGKDQQDHWRLDGQDSSGIWIEYMRPGKEFSSTFEAPLSKFLHSTSDLITACVEVSGLDSAEHGSLVISIEDTNQVLRWEGFSLNDFHTGYKGFHAWAGVALPTLRSGNEKVKVYVTNDGGRSNFQIKNLQVHIWPGNPSVYGLREDRHLLMK